MKRSLQIAALLLVLAASLVILVVRSAWFHEQVRLRFIEEIENATGGKVQLAGYSFDWRAMQASATGLVIRGLEDATHDPLFRAQKISIGLKFVSAFRHKVDLESIAIEEPQINVIVGRDGRTNLPTPKVARRPGARPIEEFLNLAVGRYHILRGTLRFDSRAVPIEIEGRNLDLVLNFDRKGPAYQGRLEAEDLKAGPAPRAAIRTNLRIERDRAIFTDVDVQSGRSRVKGQATVDGYDHPRITGSADGSIQLAEFAALLKLPVAHQGEAGFSGTFTFKDAKDWSSRGTIHANGISFQSVDGIQASAAYEARPGHAGLAQLRLAALGGEFQGKAAVDGWSRWEAEGEVKGIVIDRALAALGRRPTGYGGAVAGTVKASGPDLRAEANLAIAPASGGTPVSGEVSVDYGDQIRFGPSHLNFPASSVAFRGTLNQKMEISVSSRDLNDFLPALDRQELPLRLDQGLARFDGEMTGDREHAMVRGRVELRSFLAENRRVQRLEADIEATAARIRLANFHLAQDLLDLRGYGALGLENWKTTPESTVSAKLTLQDTRLEKVLEDAKLDYPVQGTVTAQIDIQGTRAAPRAAGHVTVGGLAAYGETFDRAEADFRYTGSLVEIVNGRVREGAAAIEFTAAAEKDAIRVQAEGKNGTLQHWALIHRLQPNLDGKLSWKAELALDKQQISSLNGEANLRGITVSGRPAGEARLTAKTQDKVIRVALDATPPGAQVTGSAEWNVGGNTYALGQIQAKHLTFATLQDLGILGEPDRDLAIQGFFDGEIGFSGPALKPELWTGSAKITTLEVQPLRKVTYGAGAKPVALRNQAPLVAHLDGNGLHMQSVHLIAEGTDLEAEGDVSFRRKNPWNLRLRGRLNLPALSSFEPDLVANGVSKIDAVVRGSYDKPQLSGRMEIAGASFNLRNIPNGLDKVNGTIVFDRTRANIEKLSAQTGGGELNLSGFVDFGQQELLYRLQGAFQRVRVRYPEAVSTTFNGNVSLTGTASRSLLAGVVTINRIALDPRTDLGALLAEATGRSTSTTPVSPNDFLRGMQLDLKLETAADAELRTSLARDIAPEADLRVRGSAVKPTLIGRVSVSQGEIQFFGSQYSITRGDISFFNPAKIEPVIDFDFETRVRGITVNINFTGPISKLDVSYRSDPPLQSSEIVALLTVGRTPGSGITPNLPAGTQSQTFQQSSNNTLLGQAISTPLSGRLNRLFGVSRIKIDPELTGVTNTPQARLTVEQQLSRDVTVTYITNLNRTEQRIVRLQWDFSKDFSVLAVRDENGIFGLDFLWRKRFR